MFLKKEEKAAISLYPGLKPALKAALNKGQISPFEFVLIDEWYRSKINDPSTYGILDPPLEAKLKEVK